MWFGAGMHLASASQDRTIAVWNVRRHRHMATRRANAIISDLAWEPDKPRLVGIGEEGSLYEWAHALPAGLLERSSPLDELADCAGDEDDDKDDSGGKKPTYSFDIGEFWPKLLRE